MWYFSSHWLPVLTVLLLLIHTTQAWGFECPKQCECHNLRDPNRVSTSMAARCRVNESMDRYNFSVFSPRYTTVLVVQCQGKPLTPVNHMFRDLFYLEELVFKDCRFNTIPDYALAGLTNLKNFSIFGADRLTFPPHVFQKLLNLQNLEILRSGFKLVPVNFLCRSARIQSLTFSENEIFSLSEMKNLCLTNSTLLGQITRLDLSYNKIKVITDDFDGLFTGIEMVNFVGNQIETIANNSCSELYDLTVLDLSRNRIKSFPPDFLDYSDNLQQLGLSHNPISRLFPVFKRLTTLRIFEAEYTKLDDSVWGELIEMTELNSLNIAHCRLSSINRAVMNKLTSLTRLNLHSNSIGHLAPNVFSSNRHLEVLILTNNSLIHLGEYSLHGLTGLKHLDLSYNNLSAIHIDAFHDLIHVEKLDMSYNELLEIPNSIHPLNQVQELYFEGNQIRRIYKDSFKGMDSVNRIVLAKNLIHVVDANSFALCLNLHILDLSENNITNVHEDAFEGLKQLIGVSLAHNNIRNIGTALWKQINLSQVHLQNNLIEEIMASNFPDSIKFLNISHNRIREVRPFTFSNKDTLVEVDLRANRISRLTKDAISVSHRVRAIPDVYLMDNPFRCDCNLVWLKQFADVRPRKRNGLPYIPDLDDLECQSDNTSWLPTGRIYHTSESDFLCKYLAECAADCICCHFDMCDCKSICPSMCNCYRSFDRRANFIDCTNSSLNDSRFLPSNATKIFLSGNRLGSLSKHSFLRQREMLIVLYLNRSHITDVQNGTFTTLINLRELYMHDNLLSVLTRETFQGLTGLELLTLNNNLISYIAPGMFTQLPRLKTIDISGNGLHTLDPSFLAITTFEMISLRDNPWLCKCPLVMALQEMYITDPEVISQPEAVLCDREEVINSTVSQFTAYHLFDYDVQLHCLNITTSGNFSAQPTPPMEMKVILALAIFSAVFIIVMAAIISLVCYREELKVWFFTQYGWRVGDDYGKLDDSNRKYDVFVAYTSKNAMFVEHELAPRLERRDPPYRVCLTCRDYDVDISYAQNTINSINNSKRTLMLVSNDFFCTEWFRYDFQINNHDVLKALSDRLIVVLMEKIDKKKLNCDLMFYSRSKKYLRYHDARFWDKLYYMLPKVRGLPLIPQTPESVVSAGELRDQCCNNIAFSKTSLESGYEEINFVRKNFNPNSDQNLYMAPVSQRT